MSQFGGIKLYSLEVSASRNLQNLPVVPRTYHFKTEAVLKWKRKLNQTPTPTHTRTGRLFLHNECVFQSYHSLEINVSSSFFSGHLLFSSSPSLTDSSVFPMRSAGFCRNPFWGSNTVLLWFFLRHLLFLCVYHCLIFGAVCTFWQLVTSYFIQKTTKLVWPAVGEPRCHLFSVSRHHATTCSGGHFISK